MVLIFFYQPCFTMLPLLSSVNNCWHCQIPAFNSVISSSHLRLLGYLCYSVTECSFYLFFHYTLFRMFPSWIIELESYELFWLGYLRPTDSAINFARIRLWRWWCWWKGEGGGKGRVRSKEKSEYRMLIVMGVYCK